VFTASDGTLESVVNNANGIISHSNTIEFARNSDKAYFTANFDYGGGNGHQGSI
jgi:hypothetical protein